MKVTTLCYLFRRTVQGNREILLAMKKRGFGQSKWNGPGGKVEKDEGIINAAIRECEEEVGVRPTNLQHKGVLFFHYNNNPEWNNECHIFASEDEDTELLEKMHETEEMMPKWFDVKDIPYEKMWADDEIWLKELIEGKDVNYAFYFNQDKLLTFTKVEGK